jgi:transposase
VIAEGGGRAIGFALAPGPAHELPLAPGLLDRLPEAPLWVVGDRGLASHALRERVWDSGARPAIPPKRGEEPIACPTWIYHNRNLVERLWARLKEWRAVATRYEKTARSFLGVLCLAAAMDWLRGHPSRGGEDNREPASVRSRGPMRGPRCAICPRP